MRRAGAHFTALARPCVVVTRVCVDISADLSFRAAAAAWAGARSRATKVGDVRLLAARHARPRSPAQFGSNQSLAVAMHLQAAISLVCRRQDPGAMAAASVLAVAGLHAVLCWVCLLSILAISRPTHTNGAATLPPKPLW